MNKKYDLIVIGTGTAGSAVAFGMRAKGWKVAVIDKNPFGGTCSQRGCDPKKVLTGAAEVIDRVQLMREKGINWKGLSIDWKDLMKFKRTFTRPVPKRTAQYFRKAGIDSFQGIAKFTGRKTIEINNKKLEAKKILIAGGQKPANLKIQGEEYLTDSIEFLELDALPPGIVFIGGGYIAFEFAAIASRAGSKIHILQNETRPLKRFDPELVDMLLKSYKNYGINISVNTNVIKIEKKNNKYIVYYITENRIKTLKCDLAVHAAGHTPDIDELNLHKAGIKRDEKGIIVNSFMQSISNPDVYSAGDSASGKNGLPLTPIAEKGAEIVIHNLLNGNSRKADFKITPSVVFTLPPLASVGMSEKQAEEKGIKFKKNFKDSSNWYSSKRIGMKNTGLKLLIEKKTNKIIGAHILSDNAEEVINFFSLAMSMNMTIDDLKKVIFAYPTHSSDIKYMINIKDFT